MKGQRKILIAFLLNLGFSIFEFLGGWLTGSVSILSDALHDMGDAAGIGLSWLLEKKSMHRPDSLYTYGYGRYSVLGSLVITLFLLLGSVLNICNALWRIFRPVPIRYDGMIPLAVIGVCVNLTAALVTAQGESLNRKAVNLHMLEDVLGWVVVLVGAVVMRFTDLVILDPLMSVGVALFILIQAVKNLRESLSVFLEKAPEDMDVQELKVQLCTLEGVADVRHIHLWSIDGIHACATMHLVVRGDARKIKEAVRRELTLLGIGHATLEVETEGEHCCGSQCGILSETTPHHHCHHRH